MNGFASQASERNDKPIIPNTLTIVRGWNCNIQFDSTLQIHIQHLPPFIPSPLNKDKGKGGEHTRKVGGLKSSVNISTVDGRGVATPRACIRARARDRAKLDRRERGGGALPPRPKKWGGWSIPCPPESPPLKGMKGFAIFAAKPVNEMTNQLSQILSL